MLETKTFRGLPFSLSPALTEKIWLFTPASSSAQPCQLFLGLSGHVKSSVDVDVHFWRIENHQLLFLDHDASLLWQSVNIEYRTDGRMVVALKDPCGNISALLEEQDPKQLPSDTSQNDVPSPQPTKENSSTPSIDDAEFVFPSDLERTSSALKRVLIIGSSIAALCHEQLTQQHPDIQFDFVPYEYVAPLLTALPVSAEEYDLIYLQPSLRSVLGDDIVWGERFNTSGFGDHVLANGHATLKQFVQHIADFRTQAKTPLLVTNFLTPQQQPVPYTRSATISLSLRDIVQQLNTQLEGALNKYPDMRMLDLDAVSSIVGKRYLQDDLVYFYTHNGIMFQDWDDFGTVKRDTPIPDIQTFYPSKRAAIGTLLFRQMIWGLRTLRHTDAVKAVIFGLDNTLWRGCLTEDNPGQPLPRQDGWPMGLWETIQYLRGRGIAIALCADSDKETVTTLWDKIIEPRFLSLEDFDCVELGSTPVNEAIRTICDTLKLKPAEIVVVEASAARCAVLAKTEPDIRIIGNNPYLLRRILLWAAETQAYTQNNLLMPILAPETETETETENET
ncbi:MAG: phosphatase [Acetobacter sp.]|nr:phosphatase [Acetobacter sp.]